MTEENYRFYCPQCKHFCWLCCVENPDVYSKPQDRTKVFEFAAVKRGEQGKWKPGPVCSSLR